MRAYISGCIKAITPFHLPKSTVVFARHPRVAQALYNHQDALKQWAAIKRHAPEAPTYDGHAVASGFHFQCHLSTLERQVISGSSGDTYFPGKGPMWEQFREAWESWCATNHLPGPPRNLEEVFQAMWSQRAQMVASNYKYHNRIVDSVKSKTEGAIWHCEDRQPRAAVCYCPALYRTMLDGTFCNKNVFQEETQDVEGELHKVQKAAKRALQRRYPWAVGFSAPAQRTACICAA